MGCFVGLHVPQLPLRRRGVVRRSRQHQGKQTEQSQIPHGRSLTPARKRSKPMSPQPMWPQPTSPHRRAPARERERRGGVSARRAHRACRGHGRGDIERMLQRRPSALRCRRADCAPSACAGPRARAARRILQVAAGALVNGRSDDALAPTSRSPRRCFSGERTFRLIRVPF